MNSSEQIKCPVCGESNFHTQDNVTFKCRICNASFFSVEKDETHTLREAQNAMKLYDFAKADLLYENLINETQNEKTKVMAYLGRLLAYFGIVYIRDFNHTYVVTFSKYDPDYESIKETSYYEHIRESKYALQYGHIINGLDEAYKKIREEINKQDVYDLFICTKISIKTHEDSDIEGYTIDSEQASRIYDELTKNGLKVFYSERSLAGIEYDGQIYSALMNSKNILVITTKKEYLESSWVQSEWQRWMHFIKRGVKTKDSLYLYIPNNRRIDLPQVFTDQKVQTFDDSLKLINNIKEKLNKKDNESDIDQLIRELEEIRIKVQLGKSDEYSSNDILMKCNKLIDLAEKDPTRHTWNANKRSLVKYFKDTFTSIESVNEKIIGLWNVLVTRNQFNLIEYDKIVSQKNELDQFQKFLLTSSNTLKLYKNINDCEQKISSLEKSYDKLSIHTVRINEEMKEVYNKFVMENDMYDGYNHVSKIYEDWKNKITRVENYVLNELELILNNVNYRNNEIRYTRKNYDYLKQFQELVSYLSPEYRKQYAIKLKELETKYDECMNEFNFLSQEVNDMEREISHLRQGSKKINLIKDRYDRLTPEQKEAISNKEELNYMFTNFSSGRKSNLNSWYKVNIGLILLFTALFIYSLFLDSSVFFYITLVLDLCCIVPNIIINFYLKIFTNNSSKKISKKNLVFIIVDYIMVLALIMASVYLLLTTLIDLLYLLWIIIPIGIVTSLLFVKKVNKRFLANIIWKYSLFVVILFVIFKMNVVIINIPIDDDSIKIILNDEEVNCNSKLTPKQLWINKLRTDDVLEITLDNRMGYTFNGWYLDSSFETEFDEKNVSGIVSIHSQFIPNQYSVKFDVNKPEQASSELLNVPSNTIWTYDENGLIPSIPSIDGWILEGWYKDKELLNKVCDNVSIVPIPNLITEGEITLYAKWIPNPYKIYLNYNTESIKSTPTNMKEYYDAHYDTKVIVDIPFSSGYKFLGWYDSLEDGNLVIGANGISLETYTLKNDITLFAKWEKTYADYEYVASKEEFNNIRNNPYGKYKLVADIDLSGVSMISSFSGELDGLGHTISGWKGVQNSIGTIALFATNYGTIKNLHVSDFVITSTDPSGSGTQIAGLICGSNRGNLEGIVIENCSASLDVGSMSINSNNTLILGLLAGESYGTITSCTVYRSSLNGYCGTEYQHSEIYCGSLVGRVSSGSIINSCAYKITSSMTVKADYKATLGIWCNEHGAPRGYLGGIVGKIENSSIHYVIAADNSLRLSIERGCDCDTNTAKVTHSIAALISNTNTYGLNSSTPTQLPDGYLNDGWVQIDGYYMYYPKLK